MEQTFVLISYIGVRKRIVGSVVKAYEDMGLSLKGLMLTCVGNEFAEKFCEDDMVAPPECIAFYPVVAMLLEGHEAINRVCQCQRRIHWGLCYNSYSAESAKKDINLWFGDDGRQVNWSEEIERQNLAMWYPDGRLKMSKRLESVMAKGFEKDYLWVPRKESQMIFIRIESDAVQNGLVGNILSVLEEHFLLRGLRLADKDEAFAKSNDLSVCPSSSGLVKDCGSVVITVWEGDHDEVQKLIKVKDEDGGVKMDDDNLTTEINRVRDFIYISSSTKDILDWFPSGMILRSKHPREYPRYTIFLA